MVAVSPGLPFLASGPRLLRASARSAIPSGETPWVAPSPPLSSPSAVNPLIADAFALYVKTMIFHWHASRPRFRDDHLLVDEQAESIFASIDILAERVRTLGGTTIRGVGDVSRILPGSPDDPGAHEAGVVFSIDRSLGGTNLRTAAGDGKGMPRLMTPRA